MSVIIKTSGNKPILLNGKLGNRCCCPAPNQSDVPYKFSIPICDAEKIRKGGTWSTEISCGYDETVTQYYPGGCPPFGPGYFAYDRQLQSTQTTTLTKSGCSGGNITGFLQGQKIGEVTREAGILSTPPYIISPQYDLVYGFRYALEVGKEETSISFNFFVYGARTFFTYYDFFSDPRPASGVVTINVLDQSFTLNGTAYGVGSPAGASPFNNNCNIGWTKTENFSATVTFTPN